MNVPRELVCFPNLVTIIKHVRAFVSMKLHLCEVFSLWVPDQQGAFILRVRVIFSLINVTL